MKLQGTLFIGFILLLVGIIAVTSLIPTAFPTPDNAIVYFDDAELVFFPEPCAPTNRYEFGRGTLRAGRYIEVTQNEFEQSTECPLTITQKGRNVFLTFVTSLGFLDPLPPRWDESGHWKY